MLFVFVVILLSNDAESAVNAPLISVAIWAELDRIPTGISVIPVYDICDDPDTNVGTLSMFVKSTYDDVATLIELVCEFNTNDAVALLVTNPNSVICAELDTVPAGTLPPPPFNANEAVKAYEEDITFCIELVATVVAT